MIPPVFSSKIFDATGFSVILLSQMLFSLLGYWFYFPSNAKCNIDVRSRGEVPLYPPCDNLTSHQL